MGIFLKGDVYWFIKQHKGRRVEQSLFTKIKREAEKRYATILPTIVDGSYFYKPQQIEVPTVMDVIKRYMREVSPQQRSHHRNQAICEYWISLFGEEALMTAVTKSKLSTYKAQRLNGEIKHGARQAGHATVKKELSFLRQVFNHASLEWEEDWGGFFKNFVNPVKRVIKGLAENKRIRYLSEKEAQDLAIALPQWLFEFVVVSCETGLRRGKIIDLRKSEIDLDGSWINVSRKSPREKNVRPVKMTRLVKELLRNVLEKSNPKSEYVFCRENGKRYSPESISMAFKRACEAAGIDNLRLHDLRHDFASRLINAGATLYQVQHQLAHSDPRITQRYAHLLPENQNVVDKIDGRGTSTILMQTRERAIPKQAILLLPPPAESKNQHGGSGGK